MKTSFGNGIASYSDSRYDGYSIDDLFNDDVFSGLFDLRGTETVEAKSDYAGSTWETVDRGYVVQAGDQVRFSRATGDKGFYVA